MGQPKCVALSCFLYRTVLLLGPSTFRIELQPLLLSDFRHLCLQAHADAGAEGVFALLPNHMLHTFCDICGEHFDLVKFRASKMIKRIYIIFEDKEYPDSLLEVMYVKTFNNLERLRSLLKVKRDFKIEMPHHIIEEEEK